MGLGVYMNNMSEYEDAGQQVKDSIDQETFSPDFKSRSTSSCIASYSPPK